MLKKEKLIKATQSYEYIVSLILKDKMQVPITWLLESPNESESIFFVEKKYMTFPLILYWTCDQ